MTDQHRSDSGHLACPACGSTDTIPIAYGYPGSEMLEQVERGEIVLGGCCIEEHQPTRGCRGCKVRFEAQEPATP